MSADLRQKGPDTIAHELNLARAAIWSKSIGDRPLAPKQVVLPVLYGTPMKLVAGPLPTLADERLFAELVTRWMILDCPSSREVPCSLTHAAGWLGLEGDGGRQRREVKASLARLRSATFESPLRHPTRGISTVQWGMIDRSEILPAGSGPKEGAVWIGSRIAELVEHGSIVYLHRPTWDAIREMDELAGRLWTFLEGERLPAPPSRPWRHRLFNATAMEGEERQLPPISELLQIADWTVRRKVAQRVRQACTAICRADPRYELELMKSPQPGMWRLEARRRPEAVSE